VDIDEELRVCCTEWRMHLRDHINADPKGKWYRLVRQKIDQEFVHGSERVEKKEDATECFIVLIICSTCFGHLRVCTHHQELEQQAMHKFPHPGRIACCSAPNSRPPATKVLHTICGNNTSIVLSS